MNLELTPSQIRAAINATREHRLSLTAELATGKSTSVIAKTSAQRLDEEIRALQAHEKYLEERLFIADSQASNESHIA